MQAHLGITPAQKDQEYCFYQFYNSPQCKQFCPKCYHKDFFLSLWITQITNFVCLIFILIIWHKLELHSPQYHNKKHCLPNQSVWFRKRTANWQSERPLFCWRSLGNWVSIAVPTDGNDHSTEPGERGCRFNNCTQRKKSIFIFQTQAAVVPWETQCAVSLFCFFWEGVFNHV